MKPTSQPKYFKTPEEFRIWLEKNHTQVTEIEVGFYKDEDKQESLRCNDAVDQAICFGWIDGVRQSIDKYRYAIRFKPRTPSSPWSEIHIQKLDELTKKGLMRPSGMASFLRRKDANRQSHALTEKLEEISERYTHYAKSKK